MDTPNQPATISLVAAITMLALSILSMCIGFIPFVGMLSLFIYPINVALAITSIITGILGIRRAAETGAGKGKAIAGTIIGSLYLLLQLVMIVIIVMMGGLGVFLIMLENM